MTGGTAIDYAALEQVLADLVAALAQVRTAAGRDLPDGCGAMLAAETAAVADQLVAEHRRRGRLTWTQLLEQAVHRAYAQTNPSRLREALLVVAATSITWVQVLDQRAAQPPATRRRPGQPARPAAVGRAVQPERPTALSRMAVEAPLPGPATCTTEVASR